jgi:hypothetical protein
MHILNDLFGPGTWGTGGNLVAWVICGAIGFGWLHSKEKARHLAHLDAMQRHHAEAMALANKHHAEVLAAIQKGKEVEDAVRHP